MASLLGRLVGPNVTVETDSEAYGKGESIDGVVVFKLPAAKDVKVQVVFQCHGTFFCSDKMIDKTAIKEKVYLHGSSSKAEYLEAGEHRLPFRIKLMRELIPSFDVGVSKVSYSVIGRVSVSRSTSSGKKAILITEEYDEEEELELVEHIMSKRHTLAGIRQLGPIALGELDLTVDMPNRVEQGASIEVSIKLNNFSMKSARGVKYKLEVRTRCLNYVNHKTVMSSFWHLEKGTEECQGTITLSMGSNMTPSFSMKAVELSYILLLEVDVALGDSAVMEVPVRLVRKETEAYEVPGFDEARAVEVSCSACNYGL